MWAGKIKRGEDATDPDDVLGGRLGDVGAEATCRSGMWEGTWGGRSSLISLFGSTEGRRRGRDLTGWQDRRHTLPGVVLWCRNDLTEGFASIILPPIQAGGRLDGCGVPSGANTTSWGDEEGTGGPHELRGHAGSATRSPDSRALVPTREG